MNYKEAGVDIEAGNELIKRIKPVAHKTHFPNVLSSLGGFGAMVEIPKGYSNPVLVSGTDGVGTKLKLAIELNKHDTIGIDLVAMCVNDIIVHGANPLFFLDYFSTSKLNIDIAEEIITGIAKGCELSNMSLVGGETAEMPGIYQHNDYDLAGFAVGVVDKHNIIDGSNIKEGDVLIGLKSSGFHSNGYSLIRKIVNDSGFDWQYKTSANQLTLGEQLLEPTKIYTKSIKKILEKFEILGMSHITGGGITENIPRMIPKNLVSTIDPKSWPRPYIVQWFQENGQLSEEEMLKTFNCGIGMVLCITSNIANDVIAILETLGEQAYIIGEIYQNNLN